MNNAFSVGVSLAKVIDLSEFLEDGKVNVLLEGKGGVSGDEKSGRGDGGGGGERKERGDKGKKRRGRKNKPLRG